MPLQQRDVLFALRQGHFIGLADETGYLLACDPNQQAAVARLLLTCQTVVPLPRPTMLIADAGHLTLYARPVPEVAYDLVDFAERPVTVLLRGSVGLPAPLDVEVPLRKSLNDDIKHLLGGFGRGLLTLPFESEWWPSGLERPEVFWGTLPAALKVPRILRLGVNGEVDFIRK
jgi:L-threonylcarbamoyladenylate synthase